jgi:hypothetical protein
MKKFFSLILAGLTLGSVAFSSAARAGWQIGGYEIPSSIGDYTDARTYQRPSVANDVVNGVNQGAARLDRWRLQQMTPPPPFWRIHVHNNSGHPIAVAVSYIPYSNGQSSLAVMGGSPWLTRAWFLMAPGQTIYAGNTANSEVLIYGKARDGSGMAWRGNIPVSAGGKVVPFQQMNIIGSFGDWTENLNP